MRKGKFEKKAQRRSFSSKFVALMLACVLLIGGVVNGTIAWLTAKTTEVTNVFTESNIFITLQENKYDAVKDELTEAVTTTGVDNYKMIPGWTIPKNPWLTVEANSEDCYLFIRVEEKGGNVSVGEEPYTFDDFISYNINGDNWEKLIDANGVVVENVYVYKRFYESKTTDTNIEILGYKNDTNVFVPNKVLVKDSVTKDMMNAFDSNKDGTLSEGEKKNFPTLAFTAYASQYWKNNNTPFTAIEAWENAQPATTP